MSLENLFHHIGIQNDEEDNPSFNNYNCELCHTTIVCRYRHILQYHKFAVVDTPGFRAVRAYEIYRCHKLEGKDERYQKLCQYNDKLEARLK